MSHSKVMPGDSAPQAIFPPATVPHAQKRRSSNNQPVAPCLRFSSHSSLLPRAFSFSVSLVVHPICVPVSLSRTETSLSSYAERFFGGRAFSLQSRVLSHSLAFFLFFRFPSSLGSARTNAVTYPCSLPSMLHSVLSSSPPCHVK